MWFEENRHAAGKHRRRGAGPARNHVGWSYSEPTYVEYEFPGRIGKTYGGDSGFSRRREPAGPVSRPRTNLTAIAFGLAAMVFLPLIVFSLVPSGLAGTETRSTSTASITARPWFGPVTVEAESSGARLGGSARLDTYPGASGGRIVRGIGSYATTQQPGTLTVGVTVPAAGLYTLTFYYVHIDGMASRSVDISADGVFGSTVTVSGTNACCMSKSVGIYLRTGANSITFSNPRGKAPSIDRVVVSAS